MQTTILFRWAAIALFSALTTLTSVAQATTFFPDPGTKTAIATITGSYYLFSVTHSGALYYAPAAVPGRWQLIAPPAGVAFMSITGVATAASPVGAPWGDSRLYAIGQVGAGAATLYELALSNMTW